MKFYSYSQRWGGGGWGWGLKWGEARGELTGNGDSLPARSGFEDLSSLPVDPGCGKRSECAILKSLQIKYIDI